VGIKDIGKKLGVDTILEGSVRKAGKRLRITAQLVNVGDGYHLWSERYDREMDDIFTIQDEITTAIVGQLQSRLIGKQKRMAIKRYTENLEAYDRYLRGIYYWNKLTPDGFKRSIPCFEEAIKEDPHYALAYAGMADSYWFSSFWGNLPPHQTYPKARDAAKKAIEIDDTIGEAHATLASIHTFYDWDWEAAEREFNRAVELAPNSSYARLDYSLYLNLKRRYDEAVIQARKAQELDPLSGICNTHLAHRLWQARRYDEAIEQFQKWLGIEPNDWFSHHHLAQLYLEKSMIKEAIAEIDKSLELSGGVPMNVVNAVMIHHRFGDKETAERLFDSLKKRARREYVQPVGFVMIHLTRGETDQAFEWVKKASEERDSFLPWLRVTPMDCMNLPSDPRIDELLDQLGLP
jgi:tetratricopeptide (TPR) repeat protein